MMNNFFRNSVLLIFLLMLFSKVSYCQNSRLSSGKQALHIKIQKSIELKPDSSKVNLLYDIADGFLDTAPDSSFYYGEKSLELAGQLDYRRGIAKAYFMMGYSLFNKNQFQASLEYYYKSLSLSRDEQIDDILAKDYYNLGFSLYYLGDYEKAKSFLNEAKQMFVKLNDSSRAASSTLLSGTIYLINAKYDEALKYDLEAMNIYERINDVHGAGMASLGMAEVFSAMNNHDNALKYFSIAKNYLEKGNDKANLCVSYEGMGSVYEELKNYDPALAYYFKALKTAEESKLKTAIAQEQVCIANVYTVLKKYNTALDYYLQALNNLSNTEDKLRLVTTYLSVGNLFIQLKDVSSAVFYLNKGLAIAKELNMLLEQSKYYQYLSAAYELNNNYKSSLAYYKQYKTLSDSIYNSGNDKQILDLQTKYETEKKNEENTLLKKQKNLQHEIIAKQYTLIAAVCGVLALMIIISILLSRANSQKKKLNSQLTAQKGEIEKYASSLNETNATKDKFFSIIAHDLKNPFFSIIGITKLLIDEPGSLTEEERQQSVSMIHDTSKNAYALLENLLQWSRSQTNSVEFNPESIVLKELVAKNVDLLKSSAHEKLIKVEMSIPEGIKIKADQNMMNAVLRNLLSNAIKFTPDYGEVNIFTYVEDSRVIVNIKDNGTGIPKVNLENLFRIDKVHSTTGTKNERGSGLGLLLCKEFIEKNDGRIWVKSEEGKGSTFSFSLPISR